MDILEEKLDALYNNISELTEKVDKSLELLAKVLGDENAGNVQSETKKPAKKGGRAPAKKLKKPTKKSKSDDDEEEPICSPKFKPDESETETARPKKKASRHAEVDRIGDSKKAVRKVVKIDEPKDDDEDSNEEPKKNVKKPVKKAIKKK